MVPLLKTQEREKRTLFLFLAALFSWFLHIAETHYLSGWARLSTQPIGLSTISPSTGARRSGYPTHVLASLVQVHIHTSTYKSRSRDRSAVIASGIKQIARRQGTDDQAE